MLKKTRRRKNIFFGLSIFDIDDKKSLRHLKKIKKKL